MSFLASWLGALLAPLTSFVVRHFVIGFVWPPAGVAFGSGMGIGARKRAALLWFSSAYFMQGMSQHVRIRGHPAYVPQAVRHSLNQFDIRFVYWFTLKGETCMNLSDFKSMTNLGSTRKDNPFWYRDERDAYLHEVTANPSNANLDIGGIELEAPTAEEASQGLVFYAEVKSNIGSICVAVFQSEKNSECLELRHPKYVIVNPRIAAQVLRFGETQCVLA